MAKKQVKEGRKKHHNVKVWELYKVEGGKITKRPETCPRCRKYLAHAKDRTFCGGCGWTTFPEKKGDKLTEEEVKEIPKEEIKKPEDVGEKKIEKAEENKLEKEEKAS